MLPSGITKNICSFIIDDDEPLLNQFTRNEECKLGFNMCECGFEGIAIKVAKRSSNQEECPQENLNLLDLSLIHI